MKFSCNLLDGTPANVSFFHAKLFVSIADENRDESRGSALLGASLSEVVSMETSCNEITMNYDSGLRFVLLIGLSVSC
jgi:hypothetical protein